MPITPVIAVNHSSLAAEVAQQRGDEARGQTSTRSAPPSWAGDDLIPAWKSSLASPAAGSMKNHAARHASISLLEMAWRHPEVLRLAEYSGIHPHRRRSRCRTSSRSMAKANVGDEDAAPCGAGTAGLVGLMIKRPADGGSEGLREWWRNQSCKTRALLVPLQVAMAERLIESDDHDTARQIIIDGLKKQYDDRLVMLIPRLKTTTRNSLRKCCASRSKPLATVRCCGAPWASRRCGTANGRGQHRLRAALKQRPDAFDYAPSPADALDRHLHQPEEAAAMRRDGLLLTLQNNPQP